VKNLAQFRRALTIGSEWTCESYSDNPAYRRGPNLRTVVHVRSNAIAFSKPGVPYDGNPHKSGSWLYFDGVNGKATNWSFPMRTRLSLPIRQSTEHCAPITRS
jgi:hypothetical protein